MNQKNLHAMHELLREIQEDGIVTEKMTVDDAKATLVQTRQSRINL